MFRCYDYLRILYQISLYLQEIISVELSPRMFNGCDLLQREGYVEQNRVEIICGGLTTQMINGNDPLRLLYQLYLYLQEFIYVDNFRTMIL